MADITVVEVVAERADLGFHQGDDFTLTLTFAENVSTSTFAAQVRPTVKSSTSWAFSVDMTDAATGVVVFTLAKADTAAMPASGNWDLEETKSGKTTTLLKGRVRVSREVTR